MESEAQAPGRSDFGSLLRRYRVAAGLSQEALAERARLSTEGISALERGFRRTPQRGTLALLADGLDLGREQRRDFTEAAARCVLLGRSEKGSGKADGPDQRRETLPLALTTFIGRERELEQIVSLASEHRLVTLTGVGGIGKTQTALQVATVLTAALDVPAYFVGLAPLGDPSLLVAAVAATFGARESPNRSLLETLIAHIGNKPVLLILDNCEHVVAEAARVAEVLLTGCPHIQILATSREPLRAAAERTYRLPSLDHKSASILFRDRACAVDHRFSLTNENAAAVEDICRHLDGIPLAIELAAALVNILPAKALAEKLDDQFRLLTIGQRTALPRQQTMRAAIDWSYNLLSAPEQRVFERMSAFAGGGAVTSVTAVCEGTGVAKNAAFDLLSSLIEKSMVIVEPNGIEVRYTLLESFRQYAREKLVSRGELNVVARRHALAYHELAKRVEREAGRDPDAFHLIKEELDNWRAALNWTLSERGDIPLGQRLAGDLVVVWAAVAPNEGRGWLALALERGDERTPAMVRAKLYEAVASIATQLVKPEEGHANSASAMLHYGTAGDSHGIARSQRHAGIALARLGREAEAVAMFEAALQIARELPKPMLAAQVLLALGCIIRERDPSASQTYLAEALRLYETLGAKIGVANTLYNIGNSAFRAGDTEAALRYATQALAIYRTFDDVRTSAIVLESIAGYLISLARYDEAEDSAREMLDLGRRHQHTDIVALALLQFVALAKSRMQAKLKSVPSAHDAARILGFVDACLTAAGSAVTAERPDYPGYIADLRERLGDERVAELMAEGAAMTEQEAIGLVQLR